MKLYRYIFDIEIPEETESQRNIEYLNHVIAVLRESNKKLRERVNELEQEVQPQPQQNNSPYAQSYRRPEQQPKPQPAQDLFTREIPDARPVQEEDELPF